MSLFALPLIGRTGLGNGLFPWARAELFARRSGARVLAPRWASFRLGPYLRQEPEKRRYTSFFRTAQHVHGFSRLVISGLARRIPEEQADIVIAEVNRPFWPCVVQFGGIAGLFAPLLGEHGFIRDQLWGMTVEPLRSTGAQYGERFIAMHVRRGDITRQGFAKHELKHVNQYTPLPWFVSMARALRRMEAFHRVPIVVFTDGGWEEVEELCALEGVRLHQRQPAIADLWTLSHAGLLFASGFSTFGMWASFLGGMPTIYAPGKLQQRVQRGRKDAFEIELAEGDDLPEHVCRPRRSIAL